MSREKNIKERKGFTIIEVVLVLAIAGLIFLIVFIAFPALQRGQKDTQRRDDMARFSSQLSQYQANNAGRIPQDLNGYNDFINNYLRSNGDSFADPSGTDYTVPDGGFIDCGENNVACEQKSGNDKVESAYIRIYLQASCDGETPIKRVGKKYMAFTYKLEGAGIYCGHN